MKKGICARSVNLSSECDVGVLFHFQSINCKRRKPSIEKRVLPDDYSSKPPGRAGGLGYLVVLYALPKYMMSFAANRVLTAILSTSCEIKQTCCFLRELISIMI